VMNRKQHVPMGIVFCFGFWLLSMGLTALLFAFLFGALFSVLADLDFVLRKKHRDAFFHSCGIVLIFALPMVVVSFLYIDHVSGYYFTVLHNFWVSFASFGLVSHGSHLFLDIFKKGGGTDFKNRSVIKVKNDGLFLLWNSLVCFAVGGVSIYYLMV